ncbi:autotransporter-associated beta strand repeat-containing protein [Devosia naphthalenivorans]|uniref:autotransporter-associated beta strand repeat-containing protein n=1 Tax=Devosia naphthalenivorans TaxID=2082392 RepID=UPI001FE7DF66|nr:autotransporter-associated beta strand repeat-containing protein [Devosia naphthalenivorans]
MTDGWDGWVGLAGNGGMGVSFVGALLTNSGTISGGAGGDSGSVTDGWGGLAGNGGIGVSFVGDSLTNTGAISGGAGGNGGSGAENQAGDGGVGISMAAGSLTNMNSITGGSGGTAAGGDSVYAAGGVGIVGSDLHVINSGMISGGLAGDGATRANAVAFTSGSNRLELQAGSTIIGNVVAGGGNNVLALGGAVDATFDVSGMGTGLQYQGFTDFEKTGASTWTLEGDGSGFAGDTVIAAGTMIVGSDTADAVLGGSFAVQAGATLGGSGTLGSGAGSTVTIARGGTIAPGNSIGTLTVDGDIIFASGSVIEAEINPALESDLIDASGAATIHGGTVHALKASGVYTPGSRWTIIAADGGVTGTFDELTQNMPFIDLSLAYAANNVYIDATRNQVAFCDVAATLNQCSTGDGLETTGAGSPVYDAVAALADEYSARRALDALSGEIHASAMTALIEDSRFVRDAVNNRVRAAFGDVAAPMPIMAYGPGGTEIAPGATESFAA